MEELNINEESNKYVYNIDLSNKNMSVSIIYDEIKEGTVILDVGCAQGSFTKLFKQKKCICYGMEYNPVSVEAAREQNCFEKVFLQDLNTLNIEEYKEYFESFDYIILADVIEHLLYPFNVLEKLKKLLKRNGLFVLSIPNTGNWSIISGLLNQEWNYEDTGLLDRTHLRFFTYKSIAKYLSESNLCIEKAQYSVNFLDDKTSRNWHNLPQEIKKYISKNNQTGVLQYVLNVSVKQASYEQNLQKLVIKEPNGFLKKAKKQRLKKNVVLKVFYLFKIFIYFLINNREKCRKYAKRLEEI